MENIINRIAYLEGLADGLDIDDQKKEGKLLLEMIDIMHEMAVEIRDSQEELEEYVDIIEEDLTSLEEYVYDDEIDFGDFDLYDDLDDFDDIYDEDSLFGDEDECCDGTCEECEDNE